MIDQKNQPVEPPPSDNTPAAEPSGLRHDARHPLLGSLKGIITVAPGVDLTEPADPEWGKVYDE